MMKFVVLAALIAVAVALPVSDPHVVGLVKSNSNVQPDGSYSYSYETEDGTFREETGTIVDAGLETAHYVIKGSYQYVDADGQVIAVTYTADENGFVPVGNHIPQAISDAARVGAQH